MKKQIKAYRETEKQIKLCNEYLQNLQAYLQQKGFSYPEIDRAMSPGLSYRTELEENLQKLAEELLIV